MIALSVVIGVNLIDPVDRGHLRGGDESGRMLHVRDGSKHYRPASMPLARKGSLDQQCTARESISLCRQSPSLGKNNQGHRCRPTLPGPDPVPQRLSAKKLDTNRTVPFTSDGRFTILLLMSSQRLARQDLQALLDKTSNQTTWNTARPGLCTDCPTYARKGEP